MKKTKTPKLFYIREYEPGLWESRKVAGMSPYARSQAEEEGWKRIGLDGLRNKLPEHADAYEENPSILWRADIGSNR